MRFCEGCGCGWVDGSFYWAGRDSVLCTGFLELAELEVLEELELSRCQIVTGSSLSWIPC